MTFNREIPDAAEPASVQSAEECVAAGRKRLLIYAPVPVFRHNGQFHVEAQACNGLRLWAANFGHVTVMMPLEDGAPPVGWKPASAIGEALARIDIQPLPTAYRPLRFLKVLKETRARIRAQIVRADYLSFAIGGLFGDWGSVAAIEAHRMGRPYAVWTDRVESQVMRGQATRGPLKSRLRARLYHRPMAVLERHVIRRADIGLFHGRDTFDFYAAYCRNSELVHDIHISKADHIPTATLAKKIDTAGDGPLRLIYVGRADAMKGPLQWIDVLKQLRARGVKFQATWLGEGEDLAEMRARVRALGLDDCVHLPGFAEDRAAVLDALRRAHVFLFCHLTPESPRCLIEALVSGCPLAGYRSAFAADLIKANGGGCLVERGDTGALASVLTDLARNRMALADMIGAAARDGVPFDDISVFRHRSDLIKNHL